MSIKEQLLKPDYIITLWCTFKVILFRFRSKKFHITYIDVNYKMKAVLKSEVEMLHFWVVVLRCFLELKCFFGAFDFNLWVEYLMYFPKCGSSTTCTLAHFVHFIYICIYGACLLFKKKSHLELMRWLIWWLLEKKFLVY
jgi:hypothetical protein